MRGLTPRELHWRLKHHRQSLPGAAPAQRTARLGQLRLRQGRLRLY